MNILYFGTVCNMVSYEEMLKGCKNCPTVATVIFESALMDGFQKNGISVNIHSFPMVPTFPQSRYLYFGGKEETLPSGYTCRWLKTVNLPFIKQIIRRLDARKMIKKWAKENTGDCVILTYSIPPFLVKEIIKLAAKYHIKTAAVVPDLPQNMYINHKKNFLINTIKQWYLNSALRCQNCFDGYIYLTKSMKDVIAPNKPFIVVEGILSNNAGSEAGINLPLCSKSPRVIMYAGRLNEKYGVMSLIDAFEAAAIPDAELWLFGDGDAVNSIRSRAILNSNIRYFGRVPHEEILEYERNATLLVNLRSTKEQFTKYSFPSKTIEYMVSGTPVLTTRLEGIPDEYFEYVFSIEDNDVMQIKNAIQEIFSLSDGELSAKGDAAKQFIVENKNAKAQTRRIVDFLKELVGEKT